MRRAINQYAHVEESLQPSALLDPLWFIAVGNISRHKGDSTLLDIDRPVGDKIDE